MQYNLNHVDGLYFEILNDNNPDKGREYEVSFFDKKSNELLYYCHLKNKQWARLNRKWFSDIKVVVKYKERIVTETSSFAQIRGKRVFINFESKSLGDTIAWIPYCDKFREYFNCEVIVSTFHNYLFENSYPKLTFVGRGVIVNNIFAKFDLGWFFDSSKEPNNPILIPLQKSASDILGLGTYEEIRPLIDFDFQSLIRPMPEKYVCISTRSTSGCKEWDEWQSLIDFLVESGYKVCEVSYEETNYSNTTEVSDKSLQTVMQYIHHSEFFIGLSSGLSWLSWGLRKTVVMISNFSKNDHEFQEGCIRITNENVCHGCWNEPKFKFNKGDWYWCPEHEDTPRHFECHKKIKPKDVIDTIISKGLIKG